MRISGMSRSANSRSATTPSVSGSGSLGITGTSAADRTLSTMDEIFYSVRRSERARRVRVTVDPARGIEVVLPRRAGEREAAAAIHELRPWIERRVRELDRVRATVAARGETVPYLGQSLRIIAQPGRTRVHRRGA